MDELSLYFSTFNDTGTRISRMKNENGKTKYSTCTSLYGLSQQGHEYENIIQKEVILGPNIRSINACSSLPKYDSHMKNSLSCSSISAKVSHVLPPEVEEGNIEYKRKLVDPTPNRFEHLVTQMKWRLNEGGGKAIYHLGVDDNGHISGLSAIELRSSLETIERMARCLNATVHLLRERIIEPQNRMLSVQADNSSNTECLKAVELLVRQAPSANQGCPDLCMAVMGGMDSGKSTLIGVLTDGELDNGRGKARLNLFRHLHEVQSGRTSSLSSELLGFDSNGRVTNYVRTDDERNCRRSMQEMIQMSTSLITFLDLAGHPKYQRTTIAGIACGQPVGVILVISAISGLSNIGLEHIQLIYSLQLPMIIVLTKIDQLSSSKTEQQKRIDIIKRQLIYQFKQINNAWTFDSEINKQSKENKQRTNRRKKGSKKDLDFLPPLFPISSVTGYGLQNLIDFLSSLGRSHHQYNCEPLVNMTCDFLMKHSLSNTDSISINNYKALNLKMIITKINEQLESIQLKKNSMEVLFWVTQVFTQIPGVPNPVLVGRLQWGQLVNNQVLWLGPDQFGEFYPVQIVSLMHNRQIHDTVYAGQSASMAVHFLPTSWANLSESQQLKYLYSSSYEKYNIHNKQNLFFFENNENVPTDLGTSQSSCSSNPTITARRGMVLITYPMFLNCQIPKNHTCKYDELRHNNGNSISAVVWVFKLQLLHNLPIVSFKFGSAPFTLTPTPQPGQRVNIYAGCVCQTGIILENSNEVFDKLGDHSSDVITVRFTRHPEYLEIGRQIILTWNGNLKAVGHVINLEDQITLSSNLDLFVNATNFTNNSADSHLLLLSKCSSTLNSHHRNYCDSPLSALTDIDTSDFKENDKHFGSIDCLNSIQLPCFLSSPKNPHENDMQNLEKHSDGLGNCNRVVSPNFTLTTLEEIQTESSEEEYHSETNCETKPIPIVNNINLEKSNQTNAQTNSNRFTAHKPGRRHRRRRKRHH